MKIITVVFFIIATTAAVRDWREHRIPDGCCVAIVFLSFCKWITGGGSSIWEYLLGGVAVSLPMFLLALCVKGSFGGGDIKFMAASGMFLGWRRIWISGVCAIVAAAIYAVTLLCKGYGRDTEVPLGPFLLFGFLLGMYWNG